jgi:hypothetical protein
MRPVDTTHGHVKSVQYHISTRDPHIKALFSSTISLYTLPRQKSPIYKQYMFYPPVLYVTATPTPLKPVLQHPLPRTCHTPSQDEKNKQTTAVRPVSLAVTQMLDYTASRSISNAGVLHATTSLHRHCPSEHVLFLGEFVMHCSNNTCHLYPGEDVVSKLCGLILAWR